MLALFQDLMRNWRSSVTATLGTDVVYTLKKKRRYITNQNNGRGYSKDRHNDVAVKISMIGQRSAAVSAEDTSIIGTNTCIEIKLKQSRRTFQF
jgi:hypothetical protein